MMPIIISGFLKSNSGCSMPNPRLAYLVDANIWAFGLRRHVAVVEFCKRWALLCHINAPTTPSKSSRRVSCSLL
ncbi:hypothetical protein CEXT_784891 [Caerostris extrusa]|uniref:PIN domain-containing protein n=1 Tax=Caerostris extrusa TaxID=172846 RepID=A0AAV4WCX6_CAEEX|nr:hypothetical protein CEXT_784891 [Caerostris extrusa]